MRGEGREVHPRDLWDLVERWVRERERERERESEVHPGIMLHPTSRLANKNILKTKKKLWNKGKTY